jgi:hypothetical protein
MPKTVYATGDIPTAINFNAFTQEANAAITGGTVAGVAVSGSTIENSTVGVTSPVVVGSTFNIFPKASGYGVKVDTTTPTFPWRDMIGIFRIDTVAPPTLAVFRGGFIRDYFFAAGQQLDVLIHVPHDYVAGTDVFLHVHWSHNGTAISGNFVATCRHIYAKGHNQAIFPAEKTVTITWPTVNIATTPQYIHRVDEVQLSSAGGSATLMDTALIEPDGVFMINMDVTTIPTITGSAQNKPCVFFVDIHYQSTGIGTKAKAPNFYV